MPPSAGAHPCASWTLAGTGRGVEPCAGKVAVGTIGALACGDTVASRASASTILLGSLPGSGVPVSGALAASCAAVSVELIVWIRLFVVVSWGSQSLGQDMTLL